MRLFVKILMMKTLKKLRKNEEAIFILATATKVSIIFIVLIILSFYIVWLVVEMNGIYLEAIGIHNSGEYIGIYRDYVLRNTINTIPYILLLLSLYFIGGIYIAKMLLRPFKAIERYSLDLYESENLPKNESTYKPGLFSDYRLLTKFSTYFFKYLKDSYNQNELKSREIPVVFSRIHRPQLDKVFFFHFFLIILVIAISNSIFLTYYLSDLHEGLITMIMSHFKATDMSADFLAKQTHSIFTSLNFALNSIAIIYYLLLSFHLYGKVKNAIFAFFSTMRSFMKGNTHARVHLLGHNYLRSTGIIFNKLLKKTCAEYSVKKNSQ